MISRGKFQKCCIMFIWDLYPYRTFSFIMSSPKYMWRMLKCFVRRGHSMCPFFTFFSMKQLEPNLAMLILNTVCGFHLVLSVMFWFAEIVKQNYISRYGIDMVGIVCSILFILCSVHWRRKLKMATNGGQTLQRTHRAFLLQRNQFRF